MEREIKDIKDRLSKQDEICDRHDKRISKLEIRDERQEVLFEVLGERIKSLESTIKWSAIFVIGTFVGFFVWFVQRAL